jgi:hypothetical protein
VSRASWKTSDRHLLLTRRESRVRFACHQAGRAAESRVARETWDGEAAAWIDHGWEWASSFVVVARSF